MGSTVGKAGKSVGKAGQSVGAAAQKAKVPAIVGTAAAAGLAGGMALRSHMSPRRKVAGIPLGRRPRTITVGRSRPLKSVVKEAQQVGKEIGKAGFRLGVGDVNMEVQRGNNAPKRDSPLEVLVKGLTSRRAKRT